MDFMESHIEAVKIGLFSSSSSLFFALGVDFIKSFYRV